MQDRLVSRRIDALHQCFLVFVSVFRCNDLCDDIRMSRFDSLHLTENLMNIETRSIYFVLIDHILSKTVCFFLFLCFVHKYLP